MHEIQANITAPGLTQANPWYACTTQEGLGSEQSMKLQLQLCWVAGTDSRWQQWSITAKSSSRPLVRFPTCYPIFLHFYLAWCPKLAAYLVVFMACYSEMVISWNKKVIYNIFWQTVLKNIKFELFTVCASFFIIFIMSSIYQNSY